MAAVGPILTPVGTSGQVPPGLLWAWESRQPKRWRWAAPWEFLRCQKREKIGNQMPQPVPEALAVCLWRPQGENLLYRGWQVMGKEVGQKPFSSLWDKR